MDIAHVICSHRHLQFDLIEMYLLIEQKLECICVLIGLSIVATLFAAN